MTPRLLTEEEARAYLGGCNPASIVPPTRLGRFLRWDRFAIDEHLDEMRGAVTVKAEQTPDQALNEWRARHGPSTRRS